MTDDIDAVIERVKAWENYCVPHMAARDRSDLRDILAHINALRVESEKWQVELMSEASRVNRHVDEITALRTIVSRVERELDTLSRSHRDLAHRLAREGERAEEAEATLLELAADYGAKDRVHALKRNQGAAALVAGADAIAARAKDQSTLDNPSNP